MKNLSSLILVIFVFSAANANINLKDVATKIMSDSTFVAVDSDDDNEFKFKSPKGTIVELELNRDGSIEEASGDAAKSGDTFNPGDSLLTLEQAIEALEKAGKKIHGEWSFEKSLIHGWVYEFEGVQDGKEMEYLVSAKNGELIKEKQDR